MHVRKYTKKGDQRSEFLIGRLGLGDKNLKVLIFFVTLKSQKIGMHTSSFLNFLLLALFQKSAAKTGKKRTREAASNESLSDNGQERSLTMH